MIRVISDRRCTATTRAGEPCASPPLRDREVCAAHDPERPFGTSEHARVTGKLGGRPRSPGVVEVLRERLEDAADDWLAVLDEARTATKAVVIGSGDTARVETVPDHPTRLAAFREAFDRGYGKPMQRQEVSGPEGGVLDLLDLELSDQVGMAVLAELEAGRAEHAAQAQDA